MTEQNAGLHFRETMTGGFSLDATDPEEGCRLGRRNGTELAMHAAVSIDDIERFVAERTHSGQLTGTIDFEPMGTGMAAQTGVFNLFFPDEDPKMKLMVYELGFECNGKPFYLAGKKQVRDEPGFDLWSDTTTLFTQLHAGHDKTGAVVGAGILTLGVTDLIKLVSTIQVTGTDSNRDKVRTIGAFGRFFMGELWDTYAKRA